MLQTSAFVTFRELSLDLAQPALHGTFTLQVRTGPGPESKLGRENLGWLTVAKRFLSPSSAFTRAAFCTALGSRYYFLFFFSRAPRERRGYLES